MGPFAFKEGPAAARVVGHGVGILGSLASRGGEQGSGGGGAVRLGAAAGGRG